MARKNNTQGGATPASGISRAPAGKKRARKSAVRAMATAQAEAAAKARAKKAEGFTLVQLTRQTNAAIGMAAMRKDEKGNYTGEEYPLSFEIAASGYAEAQVPNEWLGYFQEADAAGNMRAKKGFRIGEEALATFNLSLFTNTHIKEVESRLMAMCDVNPAALLALIKQARAAQNVVSGQLRGIVDRVEEAAENAAAKAAEYSAAQ